MTPSTRAHSTTHSIRCRMQAEPAALERLCQVTRIRGFRIEQMQVHSDDGYLAIDMALSGSRAIDMLQAQIAKLHSVESVSTQSYTASAAGGIRRTA